MASPAVRALRSWISASTKLHGLWPRDSSNPCGRPSSRVGGSGLAERMGTFERVLCHAALDDGGCVRELLEPSLEEPVADRKTDEADIRHRGRIAMAIGSAVGV